MKTFFRHVLFVLCLSHLAGFAGDMWIEGEDYTDSTVKRHPWWYEKVVESHLSGGKLVAHFTEEGPGTVRYDVQVPEDGDYHLWVRANPVQTRMGFRVNGGEATVVELSKTARDQVNIAADGKADLRFLAWARLDTIRLDEGRHTLEFTFDGSNRSIQHHGMLDAFLLTTRDFSPRGTMTPAEIERADAEQAETDKEWIPWTPGTDPFEASPIDLRYLNEEVAGQSGFIGARDGRFVFPDGRPVRFWAVNGGGDIDESNAGIFARMLAKYGVNLVRLHSAVFDRKTGEFNPDKLLQTQMLVAALKKEGIYSHLSIYFPLWLEPVPGHGALPGYSGDQHPFATLFWVEEFQHLYRGWVERILTAENPYGPPLAREPALFAFEIQNEDSLFFWTFAEKHIPDRHLRKLESRFAGWAVEKYGSVDGALDAWNRVTTRRDAPGEARLGIRPLWNIVHDQTERDRDTVRFLYQVQRGFYDQITNWIKQDLGYGGLVCASNWKTVDERILGPVETLSYFAGDFIDRHGYFGGPHRGEGSAWSIRDGHSYADRSALRMRAADPAERPEHDFGHPVVDPHYNAYPSTLSETAYPRPNRFRSEAPLFYAVYGAMQDSDALMHFAVAKPVWTVRPDFWMKKWPVISPGQLAQYPAAALIYRRGDVAVADVVAAIDLTEEHVFSLEGLPLSPASNLDALREPDAEGNTGPSKESETLDPRMYYVGRTHINLNAPANKRVLHESLSERIHSEEKLIRSIHNQVELDYGRGLLRVDTPRAEILSGDLSTSGQATVGVLSATSPLDNLHVALVSLDGKPLRESRRMLLQVMTEDQPSGFQTEPIEGGLRRILSVGRDPWRVRRPEGRISLRRPDAATLNVQPLDFNGYPQTESFTGADFDLSGDTVYYLIQEWLPN